MKHIDFVVLDFVLLQLSYIIAYFTRHASWRLFASLRLPYTDIYLGSAVVLGLGGVAFSVMTENHKDILKRGYLVEFKELFKMVAACTAFILIYLFFTQSGGRYSRLVVIYFFLYAMIICYAGRCAWKYWLLHRGVSKYRKRHIILVTASRYAKDLAESLKKNEYGGIEFVGMVLADNAAAFKAHDGTTASAGGASSPRADAIAYDTAGIGGETAASEADRRESAVQSADKEIGGISLIEVTDGLAGVLSDNWVDEVMIYVPADAVDISVTERIREMKKDFLLMGIPVHEIIDFDPDNDNYRTVETIAGYECLTESIKMATTGQLLIKRLMDIAGGLVGLVLTVVLFFILGPMIKSADPKGGVFFRQERVGRNGRRFHIYKFRSMYHDAEERKKALMAQNKMADDKLFKMDNDPRILGSGPDGTRHGLGWFIRRTSLDEFPQFLSVLIGHMSLVGTRPPTVAEGEKYDLHHRARLAIKPGLTGLWQVSGRSNITDFEEVVRLDMKYINNWGIREDIKILAKTIAVIFTGEGAE